MIAKKKKHSEQPYQNSYIENLNGIYRFNFTQVSIQAHTQKTNELNKTKTEREAPYVNTGTHFTATINRLIEVK